MVRYDKSLSQEQVMDLQWSIMKAHNDIGYYSVIGDMDAVQTLVEHMETSLIPYTDAKYERELEDIEHMQPEGVANNDLQRKARARALAMEKTQLKHRALLKLAFRCGFMPLKRTGGSGSGGRGE